MKTIERIMSSILKHRIRPSRRHASTKGANYVALTDDARKIIDDLARETNLTPTEVLKQSVTLFKLALDDRKRKAGVSPSPPTF